MPITSVRASSAGEDTAATSGDGAAAYHFLRTGPTEIMRPAAAAAAARQGSAEATVVIRVTDLMGEETYFKLRMATPMKRVFDTYADRKGVCLTTLRFLLNGDRVGCDDTPASLQLGHHDQIDCSREQPGPQDWPFPRTATTTAAREWSQPGVTRQLPQAESEDEEVTAQAEVDLPRDTPDRSTETFTSIQASLEELQKATEELRKTNKELETNYSQLRRLVLLMLPMFFFVGLLPAVRWAASRQ